jgi:hypothetical protein
VTAAECWREPLARFLISPPNLGLVSDQRAANGEVMAGKKKEKTDYLTCLFALMIFAILSAEFRH